MKIGLVFPRYKYPSGDPPLGIAYIASYLRENIDCKIDIIDTTFETSAEYINLIFEKNEYDIVGISAMTSMINDALKIAELVKSKNEDTLVILGGPHPTVMPNETLQNKNVDAVCIGEGETTFLKMVERDGELENIKGIWYKKDNKVFKNENREPFENLDNLPFPSFDLLQMDKYFKNWFLLDSVSPDLKGTNIIPSRGCPYQCTYCQPTLRSIFGRKIRNRSPNNIVEELIFLKEKYNVNAISFEADTFIFNKKWVLEICDQIKQNRLDIVWGCNVRANLVSKDLLSKMRDAGCRKVYMGIESGSQRILDDVYDKKITLEQVKNAVAILKELDIKIQGYFMLGAPTETKEEINKTIKFARSLDIDEATFSITTPLPHTFLYNKYKESIRKDIVEFDYYKIPILDNPNFTFSELDRLKKKAFLEFYLAPKRIIQTIKQFSTLTEIRKSVNKLKRF